MGTKSAKEALQNLLNSGNISRAVYIDDVFAFRGEVDVEQALGWFSQALTKAPKKNTSVAFSNISCK